MVISTTVFVQTAKEKDTASRLSVAVVAGTARGMQQVVPAQHIQVLTCRRGSLELSQLAAELSVLLHANYRHAGSCWKSSVDMFSCQASKPQTKLYCLVERGCLLFPGTAREALTIRSCVCSSWRLLALARSAISSCANNVMTQNLLDMVAWGNPA
jgi:hypothetical protein